MHRFNTVETNVFITHNSSSIINKFVESELFAGTFLKDS